ncbi:hypothetical protein LRAMOSA01805 [Lichtheimia ramosa]|uniref:Non-structural maintenance of chromosomes element 1 homolog n=1 Tax=Lichtheimia ramosa TaxID=688394 RepID=A0A077WJA0_9FUNG|nr:hypothetical protein LRAMOSA01805 [Lichtheimia ramosa]
MEKASQFFNQVAALTRHQSVLHEAIPVINNELSEINMLLKETKDEWSGGSMLVMINTTEDPYVEKMTPYTPKELEYYRHLIESIVKAPNQIWTVGHGAALRLGSSMKSGLTLAKTQELLDRLQEDGWLRVCNDGSYALATRATVELETYLCQTYGSNHIHHCIICTEMQAIMNAPNLADTILSDHLIYSVALSISLTMYSTRKECLYSYNVNLIYQLADKKCA